MTRWKGIARTAGDGHPAPMSFHGKAVRACVWKSGSWGHDGEERPREGAVKQLIKMLRHLIAKADTEGLKLAPFIGIGCPGIISEDGPIEKGAQNLPGNWESRKFQPACRLVEAIPFIGEHDVVVLMHNDGVVQGLSEMTFMQDVRRWGVLTIGTRLGNARFTTCGESCFPGYDRHRGFDALTEDRRDQEALEGALR